MDLSFLLRGMVLGFSIAAPVGPIGLLCIRRTLAHGRLVGFVSGLGAATADLLYGCVAAFGLTAVTSFLTGNTRIFQSIGGLFLIYLGVQTFRSKPASRSAQAAEHGLFSAYGSIFLLTITNPITILAFAGMFVGLGAGNTNGNYGSALLIAIGVFLGSACWWLLLSGGVSLLRSRVNDRWMLLINRCSGAMIIGLGLVALVSTLAG